MQYTAKSPASNVATVKPTDAGCLRLLPSPKGFAPCVTTDGILAWRTAALPAAAADALAESLDRHPAFLGAFTRFAGNSAKKYVLMEPISDTGCAQLEEAFYAQLEQKARTEGYGLDGQGRYEYRPMAGERGTYLVYNPRSGHSWRITAEGVCQCPAYERAGICKHHVHQTLAGRNGAAAFRAWDDDMGVPKAPTVSPFASRDAFQKAAAADFD